MGRAGAHLRSDRRYNGLSGGVGLAPGGRAGTGLGPGAGVPLLRHAEPTRPLPPFGCPGRGWTTASPLVALPAVAAAPMQPLPAISAVQAHDPAQEQAPVVRLVRVRPPPGFVTRPLGAVAQESRPQALFRFRALRVSWGVRGRRGGGSDARGRPRASPVHSPGTKAARPRFSSLHPEPAMVALRMPPFVPSALLRLPWTGSFADTVSVLLTLEDV